MDLVRQGDILFLEKTSMYILVLSKDFFNKSGIAVVCPVRKEAFEDPSGRRLLKMRSIFLWKPLSLRGQLCWNI